MDLFEKPSRATFDDFWDIYPRKVGKLAAQKAFAKAIRIATVETILSGVRRYVLECKERKTTRDYIAHPATWLNAGRWDDEVRVSQKDPPAPAMSYHEKERQLWRFRLRGYKAGHFWSPLWGYPPEHGGSDIPPSVLQEWKDGKL